jgi:hypothetical protein
MRSYLCALVILLPASPCLAQADSARVPLLRLTPFQAGSEEPKLAKYALIGGAVGTVAGLLVDAAREMAAGTPEVCAPGTCDRTTRLSPPFGTSILIGAGAGLIVGGIAGWQTDRGAVRASVDPTLKVMTMQGTIRW